MLVYPLRGVGVRAMARGVTMGLLASLPPYHL
jgi:hypothetical protein